MINEEKSVSTVVTQLADKILNKIIGTISINSKCYISQYNGMLFYEGTVKEWLSEETDDRAQIIIKYIIYDVKNDAELAVVKQIGLDCSTESEKNEIYIISYLNKGKFAEDLKPSLYHELTHLYQYHMGMHKNINRYEHALERYKNGTLMEKYLALTIYYSFPHEQDAYVHQFYSMVMNEKPFSDAETCINNFQYYRIFVKNFNGILQNIKEMEEYIKGYGFTIWKK